VAALFDVEDGFFGEGGFGVVVAAGEGGEVAEDVEGGDEAGEAGEGSILF